MRLTTLSRNAVLDGSRRGRRIRRLCLVGVGGMHHGSFVEPQHWGGISNYLEAYLGIDYLSLMTKPTGSLNKKERNRAFTPRDIPSSMAFAAIGTC